MINHAWLPTGEGEMLKPEKSSPVSNAVLVRDIEAIEVPLYNINALAGIRPGQADGEEVEEMLPWINAKEGDFAVRFDGDSRVIRANTDDIRSLLLVSVNDVYPPIAVPFEEIRHIYRAISTLSTL